jgi:predicted ATPase
VNSKQIRFDEHQYEAVLKINRFYNQVLHIDPDRFEANANSKSLNALFRNIFQLINKENGNSKERLDKIKSIKSIYLYGGVGNLTLFQ